MSEASNELVVIVPLTRTPERERQYRWISPLFEHQPRFSVLKENQSVDLDNIHDLRVAVIKGSGLLPVLEQMNIANLLLNTDAIINAKLLRHNRVHAIAESQYVDTYHWRKAGFDTQELRFIPLGAKKTIYIASNLDFPVAMSGRIARAIEDLRKQGVLMDILREWEK